MTMNTTSFVLHGNICYNTDPQTLLCKENAYVVCVDGVSAGVYETLPEQYAPLPQIDCGDNIILPGMIDIHLHAPQYAFRGLGMDLELLDWLNTHAFPEETRYADTDYADTAYRIFADDLRRSATTRAVVFGTIHAPATGILMDRLEETGLVTYVGKVNMDRNSPDDLLETTQSSIATTRRWIEATMRRYQHTRPIITPRFTPTVTDVLMAELGQLVGEYELPVQSHLSENVAEVAWVRTLCPGSTCYAETYHRYGLLGPRTIMAHCIYSTAEEISLLQQTGTYIAHCPQSNAMHASGIAPIRRYLDMGMHVGLGTDIAGGANLSMFRCMADAIAVSNLRWRLVDQTLSPLTASEALYLATLGGGSFWGKVGSLAQGYAFDALVVDDARIQSARTLTLRERVERYIYLAEESGHLVHKYVDGREINLQ